MYYSEETSEFKTQECGFRLLGPDDLTFGIRTRHAEVGLTEEEKQIDLIKLIGQVYYYFRFLYPLDSFTFTSCGKTGPYGPKLNDCIRIYDEYWINDCRYFKMTREGFQTMTIPYSGRFKIELHGAGYISGFGGKVIDSFEFQLGKI